jgi:hypothetical protein
MKARQTNGCPKGVKISNLMTKNNIHQNFRKGALATVVSWHYPVSSLRQVVFKQKDKN